jgi:RNA polymerase sigma-70 factor (ECF subfamily)
MPLFREQPRLLGRFRSGDAGALETVYRAYVDKAARVVQFIAGSGMHPGDLADALQEIFIKAFSPQAREAFDASRDFGPYLASIARNVAIDRLRRSGREIPTEIADLERLVDRSPPEESGDADARWMTEAQVDLVRGYLEGLPPELVQLHRLRYVEGLSQRDAALRLGIGRQVLRTQEARLQEGLRRHLDAAAPAPASARAGRGGR